MAQKWLIPREIVKAKVAQRKKVLLLEETMKSIDQKVKDMKNNSLEAKK